MLNQTLFSRLAGCIPARPRGAVVAMLAVSALAAVQATAADYDQAGEPYRPGVHGWTLVEHQEGQAVELTRRSGDGALSTVCSDGQCNVFVEPDSACLPYVKYPVLLNSARQMGVLSGICRLIEDSHGPRLVVHLAQKEALFKAMARGDDLSLAFPTMGGDMNVIEVNMKGVMPLLQAAVSHRSPAGARGKPGAAPSYQQARKDDSPSATEVAVRHSKTRYHL